MSGHLAVLTQVDVKDPISRPGWYVLGRHDGGQWAVVCSRVHYEHIMAAWGNVSDPWPERLLVCVHTPGHATVYRHASS